jgi:hypothetical protein
MSDSGKPSTIMIGEAGKIVEYWSVTDIARVLQQVGVLPGPPG